MPPDLSIIVPAFDEEERVARSIEKMLRYLADSGTDAELIVVDDGSRDRTSRTARSALDSAPGTAGRVIRYEENRGKGFAVKTGLQAATADIALFTDADLSTP